jgi:hypothetical protein
MSTRVRLILLGGVIAVAVVAFVLASSGGDGSTAKSITRTVVVKNAKAVGGVQKMKVKKKGQVHLTVQSDTPDEIHVHGYNFMKDVKKGGSVRFDFPATVDGSFVIELEGRKQQIAELYVEP